MGKASKVKVEVSEVRELVDLIQVLKDVADMKYHALSSQKSKFNRFNESFTDFFGLVCFSQVRHPLVNNQNLNEVMENRLGHVIVVYPWPKDYTVIKPRAIKLLPCEDLLPQQVQTVEQFNQVIEESDPIDMTGYLADLWLSSKIYEIFYDTNLAAASAQTQQLDSSLGKMRKEREVVKLKYRKARRGDIDKSLREVFSARMMVAK